MQGELVVDERGRTSLARVRSHHYERYTVEEFPDGTLVLTPAITISPLELAALRDTAVMAAVTEAKTGDRSTLRRRPAPGTEEDLSSLQPAQARRSASASCLGGRTQAPRFAVVHDLRVVVGQLPTDSYQLAAWRLPDRRSRAAHRKFQTGFGLPRGPRPVSSPGRVGTDVSVTPRQAAGRRQTVAISGCASYR
jgi:hypothetical protein